MEVPFYKLPCAEFAALCIGTGIFVAARLFIPLYKVAWLLVKVHCLLHYQVTTFLLQSYQDTWHLNITLPLALPWIPFTCRLLSNEMPKQKLALWSRIPNSAQLVNILVTNAREQYWGWIWSWLSLELRGPSIKNVSNLELEGINIW